MASDRAGEIGWFSPEERGILLLENLRVSRSLAKVIRDGLYTVTIDHAFADVIGMCAGTRDETWISAEIEESYVSLHELGFAHSIEAWYEDRLVGGLYGVAINGAFFGESMFHTMTDASKVSLVHLVEHLRHRGMTLIDTQYITPHLESLGATSISRDAYHLLLHDALLLPATFFADSPALLIG